MCFILLFLCCLWPLTTKSVSSNNEVILEHGLISGAWQHRVTGKCINFVEKPSWCRKHGYRRCRPIAYLTDDCTRLSTLSYNIRIMDQNTGKYYCYVYRNWGQAAYLGLCNWNDLFHPHFDFHFHGRIRTTSYGSLTFYCDDCCWHVTSDDDDLVPGKTVQRITMNDHENNSGYCRRQQSLYRLLAPGMSWFPFLSPINARSLTGTYCPSHMRLCTITEVCPATPEGQSVVGVHSHDSEGLLLVAGQRVVNPVTCKPIDKMADEVQHWTGEGVVCCPNDEFPNAKNFISNGHGYLVHRSGKCVHVVQNNLVLKSKCYGPTALMHWTDQGLIEHDGQCIGDTPFEGHCPPFQFTMVNSLENIFTGLCLAPNVDTEGIPEDTSLTEQDICGQALASFEFKRLKGYIQHSSSKCITVNDANQLILKPTCDSFDQVFYKEAYSSPIVHSISGKCIKLPTPEDQLLSLTTDCENEGANFTYDGTTIKMHESNKCITPLNDEAEILGIETGCRRPAMEFQFTDASLCSGENCICPEGFERQSGICSPINNCHTDNGDCVDKAECVYTGPGTSMCVCPAGYQLENDGVKCTECPESNCYGHCQFEDDSEIKRIMSRGTRLVLRFLSVKTSNLADYFGSNTREIVVFTRQLTISGSLEIPDKMVTIFAEEIVKESGAAIVLNAEYPRIRVVVEPEGVDANSGLKLICKNNNNNLWFRTNSSLKIYSSKSLTPFVCIKSYPPPIFTRQDAILAKTTPRPRPLDEIFISMVLDCARVVAQQQTYAKDKRLLGGSLPVRLIQYILNKIRSAREDGTGVTDYMQTLKLKAMNLMEDLALRAEGIYKVPYLSLKAYEGILILLKDDSKLAIEKYARFKKISQEFKARIESIDSMTNVMTAIVRRNDVDIEALLKQYHIAESDMKQMKIKFDNAKSELETARKTFEAGVREYQNKMIMNAVFSIFGAIASAFTGSSTGVLGMTMELADLANDISKLTKSVFKLAVIMNCISGINDAAAAFASLKYDILPYARNDASSYYIENLPTRNGESFAVMIKEWDIMEANAEAFLGMGTAANEISGTADYLVALKTVAVWGRGYHEKCIAVQKFMDNLINKQSLQVEQHKSQRNIEESRNRALQGQEMNEELLVQMSLQKQRLRNIMVSKLMLFCDSYLYNWLSTCPVTPMISDDLYALHGKINQGLSSAINAIENFAPFVPQSFEDTIVITDNDDCEARYKHLITSKDAAKKQSTEDNQPVVNTQRCPLSDLKLTNSFRYKVNLNNSKIFLSHDRVHVDEVEVFLLGATCSCEETKINLRVSFTGIMNDMFKGKEYGFISPPRVLEFSYRLRRGESHVKVMTAGKVSEKFQELYYGVAALTTWSVSVPREFNSELLDLRDVTEVWLKLKGTSILTPRKAAGGNTKYREKDVDSKLPNSSPGKSARFKRIRVAQVVHGRLPGASIGPSVSQEGTKKSLHEN